VPDIPYRGYQLIQRITSTSDIVNDIAIDRDISMIDSLNGTPLWSSPAAIQP
jgi:hypothetical protein